MEINIVAPPGAWALLLEDQPPAGWVVSEISNDGHWDPENEKVKWGPFYEPFPTQVSYAATPPPGTEGEYCFAGAITIDGFDEDVCGVACVDGPQGAFMPADQMQPPCAGCNDCSCATCEDGRVELCEMGGYACAYRRGCNDDMTGTSRAAYIWMNGECYCWDGEDWYLTACPPMPPFCCDGREAAAALGGGSAVRELPADPVESGVWFGVAIDVQPPPGVSVVVLEDEPPSGWLVRNISNSGTWDEVHGKVKWGPYFAPSIPEEVTYELLPPAGVSGEYCFVGAVSFDGGNDPIGGDECVEVEPPVRRPMAEDCATIAPGDRCSASGTCATDGDCANESHCVLPPAGEPGDGVCYAPKLRYISIASNPEQIPDMRRRIKLDEGTVLGWAGTPVEHDPGFWIAPLVDTPTTVAEWPDVVHVYGCEIAHANLSDITEQHCGPNAPPDGEIAVHHCYIIQAISATGDIGNEDHYSEELTLCTPTTWGDTVGAVGGQPADASVGLADIMTAIAYFQGAGTTPLTWVDIAPSNGNGTPDQSVGLGDIMGAIGGFQGQQYPGLGPKNCP